MKRTIYDIFSNQSSLTFEQVMTNIFMSAVLGFLIFVSYYVTHRGTIYSKKFNSSLVVLTTLTGMVMTVIGNNIALSLGMVGALSIVRFRTAIKDSRDTVYIFWTIVVGICCGIGDYVVAAVGSAIVFAVLFILGAIKSENRMLIIIRGARNAESQIQSIMYKSFKSKVKLRVKNTTDQSVEFIYETSDKVIKKLEDDNINITDDLYKAGNVEYVNIVMQNDEISN